MLLLLLLMMMMMVAVVVVVTTRMVMNIQTAVISVYSDIRMSVHRLKLHNVLFNVKQESFYHSHCFVLPADLSKIFLKVDCTNP